MIPVNPRSLATDKKNGIPVRPEQIHSALREFAGIDKREFSKRFPLDVPAGEQLHNFWG